MAIKTSVSARPQFEKKIIPAGSHIARCYGMIQIGTVKEKTLTGEEREVHKVLIDWELPNETAVFNPEKGEQPFVFSKDYTLSMHELSSLRKMISAWRGKSLTDAEANDFDITKLVGATCMLNIVHKASKDGSKTYANLAGVSPLPKGFKCPDQVNPTRVLEYDNWNQEVYLSLPDWLADKIASSKEYKAMFNMASLPTETPQVSLPKVEDDEDLLPF